MKKLILVLASLCIAFGLINWGIPALRGFMLIPKEKTLEDQLGEAIGKNVREIPPFTLPKIPAQLPEKE